MLLLSLETAVGRWNLSLVVANDSVSIAAPFSNCKAYPRSLVARRPRFGLLGKRTGKPPRFGESRGRYLVA